MGWREIVAEKFRIPRLRYLFLAFLAAGILLPSQNEDIARRIRAACLTLMSDLNQLDPVQVYSDLYRRVYDKVILGCQPDIVCLDAKPRFCPSYCSLAKCDWTDFFAAGNCLKRLGCELCLADRGPSLECKQRTCTGWKLQNLHPLTFGMTLATTAHEKFLELYAGLSWVGIIILAGTFILPFLGLLGFIDTLDGFTRFAGAMLALVLLPLVAGLLAFGLKVMLIAAAGLAGELIGLAIWGAAVFKFVGACLSILANARDFEKLAQKVEKPGEPPAKGG